MKKILLVMLEFDAWEMAKSWSYTGSYAFIDGLVENGHSCTILPTIIGRKDVVPDSLIDAGPQILEGLHFDEAWVWCVHTNFSKDFWDWLKTIAPIRVGVVMESLTHTESEIAEYPHLKTRQQKVYSELENCTHALLADECDVKGVTKTLGIPALWNVPMIPECFVRHLTSPESPTAGFIGSSYGIRQTYLQHPELSAILSRPRMPEQDTDTPQLFNTLHKKIRQKHIEEQFTLETLKEYTDELHNLRATLFNLTLDGIRINYASVNLPSIVKTYPGRVFEAMAAATPAITWLVPDRPQCERLFKNEQEIQLFSSEQELLSILRALKDSPKICDDQVILARNTLLVRHTSRIRMHQYSQWIDTNELPNFDVDFGYKPDLKESFFYKEFFSRNPYWSIPQPNDDEQARWQKIREFVIQVRALLGRPLEIVEIGCGRGWLSNLCSAFGKVTAVEPVGDVIAYAKATFPHINFLTGDANLLNFLGYQGKFDLVICSEVIEHIQAKDKCAFVLSLTDLAAAGHGHLIITTPRKDIRDQWEREQGVPNQPIEDWVTENELRTLFEEAGCQPVKLERAFLLDIYQIWLFQKPSSIFHQKKPQASPFELLPNPSFFSRIKNPYYIFAPDYTQTAAGIRCLHSLCHALNELGEEAYVSPASIYNSKLRTPALTTEIIQENFLSGRTPIAVYPEVISGNPFSTPVVSRWLLNKPGHLTGNYQYHPNDIIFHIGDWCLLEGMAGEILSLPTVDLSIFNNLDNPFDTKRSGACYYANKYLAFGGEIDPSHHNDSISLCLDIPRSPTEIADLLRRSEVLYCYEQSSIVLEAISCGCPVLIMPSKYWDLHGSDDRAPKGAVRLANEPDALTKAKKHLLAFGSPGKEWLDLSWGHVRQFIAITQSAAIHWREISLIGKSSLPANPTLRDYWSLSIDKRQAVLEDFSKLLIQLPLVKTSSCDVHVLREFSQWVMDRSASINEVLDTLTIAKNKPSLLLKNPINALPPEEETKLFTRLRDLVINEQKIEAITLMEALTSRGSTRWEIYNDLGGHYAEQGRFPEAATVLERGAALETNSTHCLRKLTAVYAMQEDFGRTLAASALILKKEPDDQEMQLFVRDVLIATSPSLDNLSWLDAGYSQQNAELNELRHREKMTLELLDEIQTRAIALLKTNNPAQGEPAPTPESNADNEYHAWIARRNLSEIDTRYFTEHVRTLWKKHPLFELILTLRPGQETLLADTIDSLSQQFFDGWRLSIFAQIPSPDAEFENDKSKVRWIETTDDKLAEAINQKIKQSPATWIGFFECGTQFPQQTLLICGDYIASHPGWHLIYTDEDAISQEGLRITPKFKPDLNPDLLRATDYIGSFFVAKEVLVKAGGYINRPGGERYDIALRVLDTSGESGIGHIPDILFHVPLSITQQASDVAATLSLIEHFARNNIKAEIHAGLIPGHTRRINYLHATTPKVSIIIPNRNRLDLLGPCIESILSRTRYPNWEILIVDNNSTDPAVAAYYQSLSAALKDRVQILSSPGEFNFSAMNNLAAIAAQGDYLLLLNNDTVAINDDWLDVLMSHAQRPEIGVVGARLLTADTKQVQEAGMVLGMGGTAGHVFAYDHSPEQGGYMFRVLADQNYSAVSGTCLMVRKSIYHTVEGMDAASYATSNGDIDLCLKIQKLGYRIVWTPFATLIHHGAASLNAEPAEIQQQRAPQLQHEAHQLANRWLPKLANDPAWNRNLSLSCTNPITEGELVVPWNQDFHDRPRLLWMPLGSQGQAEYRTFGPMRALHEGGLAQCAAICQPKPGQSDRTPTPIELARLAPDTLIMHAPVDDVRCIGLLHYKEINSELLRIYSLDDLITNIPTGSYVHQKLPSARMNERLRLGLAASNRLIVSTEPLAEAYRDMIEDIRLLPNTLDWAVWGKLQPARRRGAKLRVGWAGAQQHTADLRFMLDVVKATSEEVDWVFFGTMPNGAAPYVKEFHEFVHRFTDYPEKLASLDLDLAVAPLEIHPFNEAKSNLRLLEYGILGWPVICTDILPYRTDAPPVTHLPNDASKWVAAIREKINEPDALAREGDVLREWVKKHYLLENNLERWLKALTR